MTIREFRCFQVIRNSEIILPQDRDNVAGGNKYRTVSLLRDVQEFRWKQKFQDKPTPGPTTMSRKTKYQAISLLRDVQAFQGAQKFQDKHT